MQTGKLAAGALVVLGSAFVGALGAAASTAPAGSSPTAQTAVTAPSTTAGASTTTSTQPPEDTTTSTTGPTTSTTTADQSATVTVDPALWSASQSVHRSGSSSTAGLLAALSPLSKYGLSPVQIAIVGMGQFPVAGPATYGDDWLEYRSFPSPHLHMGVDVDAAYGTPLRSPVNGILQYNYSDPDGYGLTAVVTSADRTFYVLAHMSATVLGLPSGSNVKQGQVIGFVGSSGDATGPHLHFEIHPSGGAAVDPKPILDAYLAQATDDAPRIIAAFAGATTPTTSAPVPTPAPAPRSPQPLALSNTANASPAPWTAAPLIRALGIISVVASGGAAWEARQRRRARLG